MASELNSSALTEGGSQSLILFILGEKLENSL